MAVCWIVMDSHSRSIILGPVVGTSNYGQVSSVNCSHHTSIFKVQSKTKYLVTYALGGKFWTHRRSQWLLSQHDLALEMPMHLFLSVWSDTLFYHGPLLSHKINWFLTASERISVFQNNSFAALVLPWLQIWGWVELRFALYPNCVIVRLPSNRLLL